MSHNILLVEDDTSLAEVIGLNLKSLSVDFTYCNDGAKAWSLMQQEDFDLIILDVMLPNKSGTDLCRDMRQLKPDQQIIMLTSLTSEMDLVVGLELGADDYLTKPYRVRELQARVKARLRKADSYRQARSASEPQQIGLGELSIDCEAHRVEVSGKVIRLTSREFDLLAYMARHPGKVFSREQLLAQVWGYEYEGYDHTLNTHINRLRKKLQPCDYLQTVWGVGYSLDCDRSPDPGTNHYSCPSLA